MSSEESSDSSDGDLYANVDLGVLKPINLKGAGGAKREEEREREAKEKARAQATDRDFMVPARRKTPADLAAEREEEEMERERAKEQPLEVVRKAKPAMIETEMERITREMKEKQLAER
ncbi:hypothetical protein KIPB_013572, partial [Kipferlia bialata]|eukprot:g13572.t1